jgi:hypothetical protein
MEYKEITFYSILALGWNAIKRAACITICSFALPLHMVFAGVGARTTVPPYVEKR